MPLHLLPRARAEISIKSAHRTIKADFEWDNLNHDWPLGQLPSRHKISNIVLDFSHAYRTREVYCCSPRICFAIAKRAGRIPNASDCHAGFFNDRLPCIPLYFRSCTYLPMRIFKRHFYRILQWAHWGRYLLHVFSSTPLVFIEPRGVPGSPIWTSDNHKSSKNCKYVTLTAWIERLSCLYMIDEHQSCCWMKWSENWGVSLKWS